MEIGHRIGAIAAPAIVTFAAGQVGAGIFYTQNFENATSLREWSSNQRYDEGPNFTRFLGRYANSSVTLTVNLPLDYVAQQQTLLGPRDIVVPTDPPPEPETRLQLLLEFDLYLIDSWDGSEPTYGIDTFFVNANGSGIFSETFANVHSIQTYEGTPRLGRDHLGFNSAHFDSIYRLSIAFDVWESSVLALDFGASGLQSLADESWGIDNINLSTQTIEVPTPGAAALLVLGGIMGLAGRRRR